MAAVLRRNAATASAHTSPAQETASAPAAAPATSTPSRPSTGAGAGSASSDAGSAPARPSRPYVGRPADSSAPDAASASVWCCPGRTSAAPASAGTGVGAHTGACAPPAAAHAGGARLQLRMQDSGGAHAAQS